MGASAALLSEVLLRQAGQVGPEPVLLVLDDYQNVSQEDDVNFLLGSLIENSPPSLHFMILTRSAPRFPLSRLRARRELFVLGVDELAFTVDETSQFLRAEVGLDLDDAAIGLVQERTEGWVAGIAMVSQSLTYGRRDKVMAVLEDPAASAWLVYDYLAEQVFDTQEPAIQDFLVKTSILSILTAPACDFLLGTTASQLALLALEDRGLFATSVGPSRRAFRYHQLFCEFLAQKLYQRESREAIRALHLTAAEFYRQEDEWEDCVRHYLKAGESMKAAQVVETIGEQYILAGFFQTLEYWLRTLPEDLTETRPWLLTLRARLSHLMVRNEEALRLLERALRLFQAMADQEGQAWTAGEMGWVRYRSLQFRQALHHFAAALPNAREGSVLKSHLLIMQAQTYREMGMLSEADASFRASMAVADVAAGSGDPTRLQARSRAMRNLGLMQLEMGDVRAARVTLQETLAFCAAHRLGEYEEAWNLASMGFVLWACGDFEESIELLQRTLSMSGRFTRYLQQMTRMWLGHSLRDGGRYAQAEETYAHSTPVGELERLFSAVLNCRAQAVRAEAMDLYRQHHLSESVSLRTTAEVVISAVMRECDGAEQALEHVREAVRLLGIHGYRLRLASALLHQARLEYELSRAPEGRASLARALELAVAGGYFHFFWWDLEVVAFVCLRALAEGMSIDYVAELAVRRLDSTRAGVLAPLLQHKRPEVRRRGIAVLSSLRKREPKSLWEQVLADCLDPMIRGSLVQAMNDGVISAEGVQSLRVGRRLSWREMEILVEYYLRPAFGSVAAGAQLRRECAQRLSISENTVRCHVNNLRGKLELPAWVTGKRVLDWAEQECLLPRPAPDRRSLSVPDGR